jgi:Tol biopolymer transport system component
MYMRNQHEEASDLRIRLFLAAVTIVGMIVLAGTYRGNMVRGAASGPMPRVTAITQVTHDGYRKTNLLADDSQVFVNELPSSNHLIAKITLAGPDRSVVKSPFASLQALDLSADHSKLLVSSQSKTSADSEFWTLPIAAGDPQRIGNLTGRDASWSADGKQLVFAKGPNLYLANGAGSQSHELYTAGGSVFAPRFSPDSQRIRFTVSDTEQNTTALWEVSRDGSNPHAMLADWQLKTTACCGSWTADGRYYIFQASQTLPNTTTVVTSLWALVDSKNTQDSAPAQITAGPMSFGNASAAGDSKKLWAIGVQPSVEVVKYEANKKKFVPLIAGLSATDVDFSSDGKWITYVAIPEGTLWRSRANGADRLQLTSGSERAALPHWSPDGKQIAYASMKDGGSWKLSLVSADGGDSEEVLPESGSQIDANWSQDGGRLMFGDFNHDTAGLNIRILNFKTHTIETVPGSEGLFSPRWSPDGKHIAAISPDNTTLMLFDFGTQKWSRWLKESAGTVSYPVWSEDSQYLYFDDLVNDAEAIRRVKVGGTEPEQVFVLGSLERYPGALGPWSGRAKDGSWMFVRDRSTQEVYQLSLELP